MDEWVVVWSSWVDWEDAMISTGIKCFGTDGESWDGIEWEGGGGGMGTA